MARNDELRQVDDDEILISKKQLLLMVPYTCQHIARLEKAGKFPRRVPIGENRVAWVLSEVRAWIAARKAKRLVPSEDQIGLL
jgi:prophage regulatory protein